jgi:hypothetical protein
MGGAGNLNIGARNTTMAGTIPVTTPGRIPPRPAPTGNMGRGANTNWGTYASMAGTTPSAIPSTIPNVLPGSTPGTITPRLAPIPTSTYPEMLARLAREQEERDLELLFGEGWDDEDDDF